MIDPSSPETLPVKYVPLDTVHVFFCTHLDIGYTDTPRRVAWKMKEHLDDALRLCREHDDFSYTIETAWVLRQWLERTDSAALRREMADRIREGRIELCAAFATPHAPFCGSEDLNQLCHDARRLADELRVEFVSVMQNDVPGYPWAYPQILRKSGVRYFLAGINTLFGGGLSLAPDQNPFHWEGVDGSRVLTFVQDGYCHFIHKWKYFQKFIEGAEIDAIAGDFQLYADDLARGSHPYSVIALIANPCDNKGPLDNLPMLRRMREWNASGRTPRFVASTPRRYFEDLIHRHGDSFPVFRGDWNPPRAWTAVKTRGPVGTIAFRRAQTRLPVAEKLQSVAALLRGIRFPAPEARAAWDALLHYGEHSAPEGGGDHRRLTRREVLHANREHYEYATRGWHDAEMLLELGATHLARHIRNPEYDTVAVFNPSGWARTNTVRVVTAGADFDSYPGAAPRIRALLDLETGEAFACDNDAVSESGGDAIGPDAQACVSFTARGVPPMGYRLYRAVHAASDESASPAIETVSRGAISIENEKYRVEVDATTGEIQCLFDKELGVEIAGAAGVSEADGVNGLNEPRAGTLASPPILPCAFNAIESPTPFMVPGVVVRRVMGHTFQRIEIRRPGSWFPETDIRLDAGASQVEWRNVFDRAAWRSQNSAAYVWHVETRFPVAVRGAGTRLVVSGPTGFRRVPDDALSGASQDSLPLTTFIAADDGECCVVIASPSDSLFLPPLAGDDRIVFRSQTVAQGFGPVGLRLAPYANLPFIEPGDDGIVAHRYALTSHGGPFDAVRAQRFGREFCVEMAGVFAPSKSPHAPAPYPMPAVAAPIVRSFVSIEDPAGEGRVDVAVFRRSLFPEASFFVLRLQELTGDLARSVRVVFASPSTPRAAATADMTERRGDPIPIDADGGITVPVGPFETVTLALDFDLPPKTS